METVHNLEDTLTFDEAASQLKISRSTMVRWINDGKVPARKIGHRWIIQADDVRRILNPGPSPSRATPQAAPETHEPKIVTRWPIMPSWLENFSPEEVLELAEEVGALLRAGGAPVNIEGLQPLIRGEVVPDPLFWRYLGRANRKLGTRADGGQPFKFEGDAKVFRSFLRNALMQEGEPGGFSVERPTEPEKPKDIGPAND